MMLPGLKGCLIDNPVTFENDPLMNFTLLRQAQRIIIIL